MSSVQPSRAFSLVFAGKAGLDTYACAASDIYQDAFGTGIFTGKGIFDVTVYRKVLSGEFPDNRILSHDLLEGSYLRCALLSDVVLMDSYPAKYISWSKRQHRWVRGDWQLLPWLGRVVPTKDGKRKNPLSGLSRYQILDNLRRSLTMPLCFVVILLSQTAFYRSAFFWFISGLLPLFIDSILDFGFRIAGLIKNAGKGALFKDAWYETKTMFEQAFYRFSFLPYEAYRMMDAVVRTIIRVGLTKKNMLEWVTAAQSEKNAKDGLAAYWRQMRMAPILAGILYALSIWVTGMFSIIAFCVFAIWFFCTVHCIYDQQTTAEKGVQTRCRPKDVSGGLSASYVAVLRAVFQRQPVSLDARQLSVQPAQRHCKTHVAHQCGLFNGGGYRGVLFGILPVATGYIAAQPMRIWH